MSNYQKYWDKYVTELYPKAAARDDVKWPGDEWGSEQRWRRLFESLFEPAGVQNWTAALEIGQGSGKYTKLVLDAAPKSRVVAFDVSGEYLKVCGERMAAEKAAGRLDLEQLMCERPDEMFLAVERLGLVRKLDAFYSMDAMVHVDLQYLVAYFLTAALVLKPGGYLVMTLSDATTERGFEFLMSRIGRFYPHQGEAVGKFEWMSNDIACSIMKRLGFEIIKAENPPRGEGRDIHFIAQLKDLDAAYKWSWALCDEPDEQRKTTRVPSDAPSPSIEWEAVPNATEYYIEFSFNKFGNLYQLPTGDIRRPASQPTSVQLPDEFWKTFQMGRPLHWRVMAECPDRKRVANRGILTRVPPK